LGLRKGCFVYGHVTILDHSELDGIELVLSIEQGSKKVYYKSNEATLFRHGLRSPIHLCLVSQLDIKIPRDAQLKLYLWNRGKRTFKIHDLNLAVYRARPNTFFPPM